LVRHAAVTIDHGQATIALMNRSNALACAVAAAMAAGCATRSVDVKPLAADPGHFASWSCARIHDEIDHVSQRAADVAYAVDARVGNNMIALGLGVAVFWPALLAMRPDGPDAQQLAQLKGRFEALSAAASRQNCGPPAREMAADRAASMPAAVGERLVYEDRFGGSHTPHETGLRITALLRDRIEFSVDRDGQPQAGTWQQDLAGNALPIDAGTTVSWQRLLRAELDLGQVVAGELRAIGSPLPLTRVRGQVVARGPQTLAGRHFEVVVIELFGDATGPNGENVRLDGVMAVDGASGLLLRLDLRCPNPDYALRRRLMRIEPASS
jgi:hypothetical protein